MLRAIRRMLRLPDPPAAMLIVAATVAMREAIRRVRDRHPDDEVIEREYRRVEQAVKDAQL